MDIFQSNIYNRRLDELKSGDSHLTDDIKRFPLFTRLLIRVAGFLIFILVWIISKTVRTRFKNREIIQNLRMNGIGYAYAFWHGRQFMLLPHHTKENICIITSLSRDGEIQTQLLKWFNYHVVRGSSSRRGREGMKELIEMGRRGMVPAIAVDGPKGPLHKVKNGIVIVSARSGKVIVPGVAGIKKKFILGSWDRFEIPYPWTEAVIIYGEPVLLDEFETEGHYEEALIERKVQELQEKLDALTAEADNFFSQKRP